MTDAHPRLRLLSPAQRAIVTRALQERRAQQWFLHCDLRPSSRASSSYFQAVKPAPGSRNSDDAAITTAVKTKLAAEQAQSVASIDVDTDQGIVSLSGTVESEALKQRAAEVARQVEGVREVVNNLQVQAGG
jgi:osmotically-inducible protein OsmY